MTIEFTRKQYLQVWLGDRYISKHVSVLEAAESASADAAISGEGVYEIRIGSEVWYEVTIRHLAERSLADLIIRRDDSPPINNPPVWDTQPLPVFSFGTASNYELDDLTSDPDLDTVTITLNTGMASLPTGVTWNDSLDRLEYDGVGALDVTSGHVATADDGTDTTDSDSFSITIATAVVMDNWPLITCGLILGSVNVRLDDHPPKGIIEAKNLFIHQGNFFTNSSDRANTKSRFATLRAANADIFIIIHVDYLTIEFDLGGTIRQIKWLEEQTGANPNDFEEYFLRGSPGGDFICHSNKQGKGFSFNWDCNNTVMQRVAEGQISQWTDFGGAENMMPTYALGLMHDTIPEKDSRYHQSAHGGLITSEFSPTEIDIPTWSGPPTDGNPDGAGYEALTINTNLVILDQDHTNGDFAQITGHKIVNGSTDRLRLNQSMENISVNSGDIFSCLARSGLSYGSSSAGEMTLVEWRTGIRNFMDRFESTVLSAQGVAVDTFYNAGSRQWSKKRDGENNAGPSSEYVGVWGGLHFERIGQSIGFFQVGNSTYHTLRQDPPGGSIGGRDYIEDDLMMSIEYNKLFLKSNASSQTGYPCIWLNPQTREIGSNLGDRYANMTVLDAAYGRFWSCLAWCMNNVMPQIEMEVAASGHDQIIMIDEEIIFAGDPITGRDFGTYNAAGNGGVKGSWVWDAQDFGDRGFWKEFDNCLIVINLRKPDNDPWIPSWQSGGQSIVIAKDRATLPTAGGGKKWQRFNRVTYVNDSTGRFNGKKATDFDTNEKILKDTVHNDSTLGPQGGGGYLSGNTIDIGPLEAIILMRVDV